MKIRKNNEEVNITIKKRVESHILEKVIVGFMVLLGAIAAYIFYKSIGMETPAPDLAIIELLIILILSVLAQTAVMIKIYELQASKK